MFMLQNVAILVWFAQPTAESVQRLDRAMANLRGQTQPGLSMIHVVKSRLQLPDDASRSAMLGVMSAHNVGLVAMVVTESGFMLSMMRSVITGLRVLTAGRFDYRINKSVDEVAMWLPKLHEKKTGVALDEEQLLHALQAADQLTG